MIEVNRVDLDVSEDPDEYKVIHNIRFYFIIHLFLFIYLFLLKKKKKKSKVN